MTGRTPTRVRAGRWVLPSILGLLVAPSLSAQITMPDEMAVDPDLPRKAGFDADRAFLGSEPIFTPLRDPEFEPLRAVLRRGDVTGDTPILAFEAGGRTLTLVSSQMSYHHVAQGDMAGEPWMVTF
jgi:hypothetical protein